MLLLDSDLESEIIFKPFNSFHYSCGRFSPLGVDCACDVFRGRAISRIKSSTKTANMHLFEYQDVCSFV